MNEYDSKALNEIAVFKNPKSGIFGDLIDQIGKPLQKAFDLVAKVPFFDVAVEKVTGELVKALQSGVFSSVRTEAILQEFRDKGFSQIRSVEDITGLPLCDIDTVVGNLSYKYNTLAGTSGAGSAAVAFVPGVGPELAIAAMMVDIPVFAGLCFRAIGEYATYYGFDISKEEEQQFALEIMNYTSSPTRRAKNFVFKRLHNIAKLARKGAWKQLNQDLLVQSIQQVCKQLGLRLTKGKLASIIPAAGVVVNSGFNVYAMGQVCTAAYFLYRERYLAKLYKDDSLISH